MLYVTINVIANFLTHVRLGIGLIGDDVLHNYQRWREFPYGCPFIHINEFIKYVAHEK